MSFANQTHQRHVSFSAMRSSSSNRVDEPRYVSPTYRSSVFSHLTEERDTSPVKTSFTAQTQNFFQQQEEVRQAPRRAQSSYRVSHVLPTVTEWAPQRHHINDPDYLDKVEEEAIVHAKKKLEQEKDELKEKKEKRNNEYKDVVKSLEDKHQKRLDHKKPKESDVHEFRESESDLYTQVAQRISQLADEKAELGRTLEQQIEEKIKRKQLEIQSRRNDFGNSLEFKPRRTYDMEEYRNTLRKQIEEKNQKKQLLEKTKQEERNERMKDLQEQEATITAYRQRLAYRKSQTAEIAAETLALDTEAATTKNTFEGYSPKRAQKVQGYAGDVQRKSLHTIGTPSNAATKVAKVERQEEKSDWELACQVLLQRKEQQEGYLRDLKEQILARKKNKEGDVQKDKQEDKKTTGLNLTPYKPKETLTQVTDTVKKQMAMKEEQRKAEQREKKEETIKTRETQKADEFAMRKQYEEFCQQKMQMLARYKKDLVEESKHKKHKGLRTVKI